MEEFTVAHYAPDGELLGSSRMAISQLSQKWLAVCSALIDGGPVFSRNMGNALAHWHIDFAAGLCYFKIHGQVAYVGAMLSGCTITQDISLLQLFADRVALAPEHFIQKDRPLCLVLDRFAPGVSEEDGHAMFQLAYHVAGAYFQWCDA